MNETVDWDMIGYQYELTPLNSLLPFLSEAGKEWLFHLPRGKQFEVMRWWKKNCPPTTEEMTEYILRHR